MRSTHKLALDAGPTRLRKQELTLRHKILKRTTSVYRNFEGCPSSSRGTYPVWETSRLVGCRRLADGVLQTVRHEWHAHHQPPGAQRASAGEHRSFLSPGRYPTLAATLSGITTQRYRDGHLLFLWHTNMCVCPSTFLPNPGTAVASLAILRGWDVVSPESHKSEGRLGVVSPKQVNFPHQPLVLATPRSMFCYIVLSTPPQPTMSPIQNSRQDARPAKSGQNHLMRPFRHFPSPAGGSVGAPYLFQMVFSSAIPRRRAWPDPWHLDVESMSSCWMVGMAQNHGAEEWTVEQRGY